MDLKDSKFEFGKTVIVAYPDTTRVGGYRAALRLLEVLRSQDAEIKQTKATIDIEPIEIIYTEKEPELQNITVELFTVPSKALSLCFITGMPRQSKIAKLSDALVEMLSQGNVESVILVSAAMLKNAQEDSMWIKEPSVNDKEVTTTDSFLSVFAGICSMVESMKLRMLVREDRRPGGSQYRQTVVFGEEFVDECDLKVVGDLFKSLSEFLGEESLVIQLEDLTVNPVLATRKCLDIESAARGLPTFG